MKGSALQRAPLHESRTKVAYEALRAKRRSIAMTALENAEQIVGQLSPAELTRFRRWFAEFDGRVWDDQIEADAESGKLGTLKD